MPTLKLPTAIGAVPVKYTISTPTEQDAAKIDDALPTILFLHADFFPSESMHPQFGDPQLRSFNLVVADSRGWSSMVGATYDQHAAADDVYQFILALKLPPVFIAGVSMGTIAGFQLAVTHPELVRGIFLASHLCLAELPEVTEGRTEIFDLWMEGLSRNDMEYVSDTVTGSHQLSYNNRYTHLTSALLKVAIERATARKFDGKEAEADKHLLVDFYANRIPYTPAQLATFAQSGIPVCLLAGDDDVAYPVSYAEEFMQDLEAAGVRTELHVIEEGPHTLNITHPQEFNTLLRQFILQNIDWTPSIPDASTIESPFLKTLTRAGLIPGEEQEPVDYPS